MEILDSFKFIADTNECYKINYIYATESSLHKPYILKRKYLRFNILSVIQWYTLIRFLYENSIKIPDCYTNYKTFYNNLSDSYICLSKSKKLDKINNFIARLYKNKQLKINRTNKRPELVTSLLTTDSQFDSYVNYLKVDNEYMTVGLLFNKIMDTYKNSCICTVDKDDFISKYTSDNNCKNFIYIIDDDDDNIKPRIMICLGDMSIVSHSNRDDSSRDDKALVNISSDAYINTLLKEYSNHILTHDKINNTMSKHIVYTDDPDVIKQVLINNNKIISKILSKMYIDLTPDFSDSNLHRKQDLLDTLRSLKVVDNKSNGTKIAL